MAKTKTKTAKTAKPALPLESPQPVIDPLADLKQAYNQGNDAAALELGAKHLAADANDINVLKIIARIHNRQQKWQAANDVWGQLLALEPQNPEPPLQLARIAVRNKQPAEALALFDKVLQLSPVHEEALLTRLTLLMNQNDMAAALPAARRVIQAGIHGKGTEAVLKLAKQLFEKHQQNGDALEIASLTLTMDSDNADVVKLRAKILATLQTDAIAAHLEGDADAAAQACRDILRSLPQHERASGILREIVRPLVIEARNLYKAQQTDASIKAYQAVLAVDPNQSESLRSLARLYAKAEDDAQAEEYWVRLEKGAPGDTEPVLQIARLRSKAGDSEAALLRYNKLAQLPGTFTEEAKTNRDRMAARVLRTAAIKARDLELDEALRLTDVVLQLATPPENLAEVRNRIEVLSAREAAHAFKAGDNTIAVAHAKRALKVNANNEKALMLLARAAHKVHDYHSALDAWRMISAMQPVSVEAWLQKARYYLRFREYESAISVSKKLLALDPSHAEGTSILETATTRVAEAK